MKLLTTKGRSYVATFTKDVPPMIIDIDGFELDFDKLLVAYTKLFKDMGLAEADDQQVYNTITVFLASLIASGLQEAYGDNPAELEVQLQTTCNMIVQDLEEQVRAFLP